MRNFRVLFLLAAVILLAATPVLAADTAAGGDTAKAYKAIGAAIGMGIASGLCGIGQGRATAGAAEAMARNPGASAGIRFSLILGLALIESLALYTLVIIYTT
jgi:F-type H+-transporting ATPase subunit c